MNSHDLHWRPSPYARRLLTLAGLGLVLGVALGRVELCALSAVGLAPFAIARRGSLPRQVDVSIGVGTTRCFEGEPVDVRVRPRLEVPVDQVRLRLLPAPGVDVAGGSIDAVDADLTCTVSARRWGTRRIGTVVLDVLATGRLTAATVEVDCGSLAVFPQPAPVDRLRVPAGRPDRSGDHVARSPGTGVEFAGIRPFAPGDSLRRINWAASTRRGALQINEAAAEHAIEVVVAVDAFDDVGPAGRSTLDLTVRGATGVVRYFLGSHDRVGLIAVGGWLRWIRADVGDRQFYRVAEAILGIAGRESYVDPDVDRIPRSALPPGAQIVYFSPLLDRRAIAVAEDLRGRGYPLIVVDVLTTEPGPDARVPTDRLVLRLWRLDRAALRQRLTTLGIVVAAWDGSQPVDAVLQPALRQPVAGRA